MDLNDITLQLQEIISEYGDTVAAEALDTIRQLRIENLELRKMLQDSRPLIQQGAEMLDKAAARIMALDLRIIELEDTLDFHRAMVSPR